jgi:hypothetical protein
VQQEGTAALVRRVRQAERSDLRCTAHPRGKAHDDASAVFVEFPGRGVG